MAMVDVDDSCQFSALSLHSSDLGHDDSHMNIVVAIIIIIISLWLVYIVIWYDVIWDAILTCTQKLTCQFNLLHETNN